jgi:hypothetical protein
MDRAVNKVSMTLDSRAFKASIGLLAIVARRWPAAEPR